MHNSARAAAGEAAGRRRRRGGMLRWVPCVGGAGEETPGAARDVAKVEGLSVSRNVVSRVEEAALLGAIDGDGREWVVRRTRRTKNYGPFYTYRGDARVPSGVGWTPVPAWGRGFLVSRVDGVFALGGWEANQAHVAYYDVGDRIRLHNDCAMGELAGAVVGVSLGAPTVMTFVHPADGRSVRVRLPRRSAYCMRGDALALWRHKIDGRDVRARRVSITLRHVRRLYLPDSLTFDTVKRRESVHPADGFRLRDAVNVRCDEDEVKQTAKMNGFDHWAT